MLPDRRRPNGATWLTLAALATELLLFAYGYGKLTDQVADGSHGAKPQGPVREYR